MKHSTQGNFQTNVLSAIVFKAAKQIYALTSIPNGHILK